MPTFTNHNKRNALLITVLYHAVLVALLFYFKLTQKLPLPQPKEVFIELGMAAIGTGHSDVAASNYGTSNEGSGKVQPKPSDSKEDVIKAPTPTESKPVVTQKTTVKSVPEKIITQSHEEAPKITEPTKPVVKEKPREVNQNAIYTGKKGNNTNKANSEGQTGKPGDQGIANGSLYTNNHGNTGGEGGGGKGQGGAGGVSFDLRGRKLLKAPEINDKSQERGNVVVEIIVDKYGTVTKATPGARGSTTTSSTLYRKAQIAALKAKFDGNPDMPEEQRGFITFTFILQ